MYGFDAVTSLGQEVPPPPPPPPTDKRLTGLHGPGTDFFPGLRSRLSALEFSSQLPGGSSPTSGLIVALVFAATVSMVLAFFLELGVLILTNFVVTTAIFAPLLEESFKAMAAWFVVVAMWKIIPNRRYGAALGAAAGLGFGITEFGIYVASTPTTETVLTRLLIVFMHPIWTAFVGMGLFVFFSHPSSLPGEPSNRRNLYLILFALGVGNHIVWNSIAVAFGVAGAPLYGLLVNVIFTLPLFLVILRDLLGGHFNFQNFYSSIDEPKRETFLPIPPPPPPSP